MRVPCARITQASSLRAIRPTAQPHSRAHPEMAALYRHAIVPIALASRRTTSRSTRAASSSPASSANCFFDEDEKEEEKGALRKGRHRHRVGYERALSLWRHGQRARAVEAFGEYSHGTTIDCRRQAPQRLGAAFNHATPQPSHPLQIIFWIE